MYRLIRNTHLILGLSCCLFLLMYGVSAVQMSHNAWFNTKPAVTESRASVDPVAASSPRALAAELMRVHGLRGDIQRASVDAEGYDLRIVRPGVAVDVRYKPGATEAELRTNKANFMGLMNRLHHLNGLWHEDASLNVWGVLVALVSAALIALGATGVYLWFRIYDERLIGGLIFCGGLVVGMGLLIAARLQP